jgi:hypothetical protein
MVRINVSEHPISLNAHCFVPISESQSLLKTNCDTTADISEPRAIGSALS